MVTKQYGLVLAGVLIFILALVAPAAAVYSHAGSIPIQGPGAPSPFYPTAITFDAGNNRFIVLNEFSPGISRVVTLAADGTYSASSPEDVLNGAFAHNPGNGNIFMAGNVFGMDSVYTYNPPFVVQNVYDIGTLPLAIGVDDSGTGEYLYLAYPGQVQKISAIDGSAAAGFSGPANPRGMVIAPDITTTPALLAYIAGPSNLEIYSLGSGAFRAQLTGFTNINSLAVKTTTPKRLFVGDVSQVKIYDASTTTQDQYILSDTFTIASTVEGIAISPSNSVYVTRHGSSMIEVYAVRPVVDDIFPVSGPVAGGTTVTITGNGFYGGTSAGAVSAVRFGTTPAASYTVDSDTAITAIAPAGTAGIVDITVSTPLLTSSTGADDRFTYVTAPVVSGISPASGPVTGGTPVTITGTGFSGATAVNFGATPATGFTVTSDTSITATAPAGTGTEDVRVTTAGGTSATSAADRYSYIAAPVVSGISPNYGPAAGGTTVTITGTGFTGATAVNFGATPATGFTVNSATSITATSPAGTGTVDVRVTTAGGTSATSAADLYTFAGVPTVTSISPTSGPAAGGDPVTITGTGFVSAGTTTVTFDSTAVTATYVDPTHITATTPAHAAGPVSVAVTTPGGSAAVPAQYTYAATPAVTDISPLSGPAAGGTLVNITGTDLAGVTGVTFGGSPAAISDNTATAITMTAPAGPAGPVTVTVTTAGGTATTTYTYVAAPAITMISPASGPTAGGTLVNITGTNLAGATGVTFGSSPAAISDNTAATIIMTVPAGPAGPVTVTVTTAGGTATTSYTYAAPPAVSGISPATGPTSGGTPVVITGSSLAGATAVSFGGTAAIITANNPTQITATSPAHAAGTVDIVVTTPGGTSVISSADRFTYVTAPTTTPTPAPTQGGTTSAYSGAGGDSSDSDTSVTPTPAPIQSLLPENVTVNVGGSTAVTQAVVTGTGISGLIITGTGASGPGQNAGTPPGIVYQYLDLTPARYGTITGAEIRFSVPQSWLDEHHLTPQGIVLYHSTGSGWQALATIFIRSENGGNYFTAAGPGFSRFAVTGQAGPVTGSPGSAPLPAEPIITTPVHSPAPAILTTAAPVTPDLHPPAAKTPSSGAGLLPVFGALGIFCGMFLLRKNRN